MKEYQVEAVIEKLKTIDYKTRKRATVDQRTYLIGLMYYKFKCSEYSIASLTGIKRCNIQYGKNMPMQFMSDPGYIENTKELLELFPFDFTKGFITNINRDTTVKVVFDKKTMRKLEKCKDILGHVDIRTTIKHFINKSLSIWEE
jgi:hypothetical protein